MIARGFLSRATTISGILVAAAAAAAAAAATAATAATAALPAQSRLPVYDLVVHIQPDSAQLRVAGTVILPGSDTARDRVTLVLHSVFQEVQFELVEPPAGPVVVTHETADARTRWTVHLPRKVPAHVALKLRFTYGGAVQTAQSFHVGADGSYLEIGWYPLDAAMANVDSRATGRVTVAAPPGHTVVGAGDAISSAADIAQGRFTFTTRVPRRLAFTAGKYVVARSRAKIPVAVYFLHSRSHMDAFADSCARALDVLSHEFGRFPYHQLAIVEVPTGPARNTGFGGRSVNGIVLASSANLDAGFNLGFIAHEISHQWWADMIESHGTDGEQEMLGEAMAGYGSLRAVEVLQGPVLAEPYRRAGYPGYQDTRLSYYTDLASARLDTVPLADLREPLAHNLANVKGFRIWSTLAFEIGHVPLRRALIAFTSAHAFRPVRWKMFTAALDSTVGRRLDWFFAQWVTRGIGMPEWRMAWRQTGDSVLGTVTQVGRPFQATVEVQLSGDTTAQRTLTRSIVLRDEQTAFAFAAPFTVRSIAIDPGFHVLHWTAEAAADARVYGPIRRAYMLDELGHPAEAVTAFDMVLNDLPAPDVHGLRYLAEYGLGWMHLKAGRWNDARTHMQAALDPATAAAATSQACREPGGNCSVPWGYYVLARAAQQLGDSTAVCRAVANAVSADSGARFGAGSATRALAPGCGAR